MRPSHWIAGAVAVTFLGAAVLALVSQKPSTERYPSSVSPEHLFGRDVHRDVEIEFKDRGELVAKFTKSALLQKFPAEELRMYEFLEDAESLTSRTPENPRGWVTYGTVAAYKLLDGIYGDTWHRAKTIRFTCVDNYQPVVDVARFFKFAGRFVFYRNDGKPTDDLFQITKRMEGNKVVPLGPMYLTWEKMEDQAVYEGGQSAVPYQVKTVDLID